MRQLQSLRVQVPNSHILTPSLYYNYYYPNPKYLMIGYMDPLGILVLYFLDPLRGLGCLAVLRGISGFPVKGGPFICQYNRSKYPAIIYLPKSCTTITITQDQIPNYWVLGPWP